MSGKLVCVKDVYFDESGQTGTHLFDAQQPYFCLGSTDIVDAEATDILLAAFPKNQGVELKSKNLLRRPEGRRNYLRFAQDVGKRSAQFCAVKVGKRYTVIAKMVDNFVEPYLSSEGFDFYANEFPRKLANSVGHVFEHILEQPVATNLLDLYNRFAREPSRQALTKVQTALRNAATDAPEDAKPFVRLLMEAARQFENLHDFAVFRDTNDIHVTAAVQSMSYWQTRHTGPFRVIHDESVHFFSRSEQWKAFTNPDLKPETFFFGNKSLKLPIPVLSTVSATSHSSASLQLCDLVAGFISRASNSQVDRDFRRFVDEAISAGFGEVFVFPVDFDDEFLDGGPAIAEGPDLIDRIAHAVAHGRKR